MTLVFSRLSFILHLAHHFSSFRRSLRKSFSANYTFLLAANRAVLSANWDFEFCLWRGFGKSLKYISRKALDSGQNHIWSPCNGADFVVQETIHVELNNSAN